MSLPIIPNGQPSWVVRNSITDIDGHTEKENRTGFGPVNPRQDLSAEGQSRLHQIAEAAEWASPFATIRLALDDAGESPPSVLMYRAQHGTGLVVAPTCTRVSDGVVEIEWATSYVDSYNQAGTVNITAVQITAEGASVSGVPSYTIEDPATIRVYADTDGSVTCTVWTQGDE